MAEEKKELTRTTIKDEKVYFGEQELTNLIRTLIRVYRFNNKNQTPKAIVIPYVAEVEDVKVEFTPVPTELELAESDEMHTSGLPEGKPKKEVKDD